MKTTRPLDRLILAGTALAWFVSIGFLYSQSIRLDESQSLWVATRSIPGIISTVAQDVHVPLYSILLHVWMQFFGTSIVAARTMSLIFFLATLPALYKLGVEAGNRRIAIILLALFSFSPFIMWFGSETRMYSLFTLVVVLHHIYFLRFVKSTGKESRLALFLLSLIGFYTHYFFLLVIATQCIYLFLQAAGAIYEGRARIFATYLGSVGAAFVFFVPWIVYVLRLGDAVNSQPLLVKPSTFNIFQSFIVFVFGFQADGVQALLVSLWPLSVALLFFLFTRKDAGVQNIPHIEYFFLATFVPVALAFLASYIRPIFLTRYLILVTPTLFFILAWMLTSLRGALSSRMTFLVLASMLSFLLYQNVSAETPVKEDYKGVVKYVSQKEGEHDVIAVTSPFTIYPIEYLYKGRLRIATIPEWNRYRIGAIAPFTYDKLYKQVEDFRRYKKVFVILSYDQGYEKNVIDYLDKNLTLIEVKKFSPKMQLRVYATERP